MIDWFAKALNVEPPLVFGVRLVPMTLGHCFALARIGSPYITGTDEKPLDAMLSAFILCQNPQEGLRGLEKWWAKSYFYLWGWRCRKMNLGDERRRLHEFIQASLTPPDTLPMRREELRELGAPFHWRLLAMLMADFHMSMDDAMKVETGFALCLWAVEGERQGKINLPSAEQVEFRKRADAALAEMQKEADGNRQPAGQARA